MEGKKKARHRVHIVRPTLIIIQQWKVLKYSQLILSCSCDDDGLHVHMSLCHCPHIVAMPLFTCRR